MSQNTYETALQFREEAVAVKAVRLYNKAIVDGREQHTKKEGCRVIKRNGFAI